MKAFKGREINWEQYVEIYSKLLAGSDPVALVSMREGEKICLLCSEDSPEYCHRRILAEYLGGQFNGTAVQHL